MLKRNIAMLLIITSSVLQIVNTDFSNLGASKPLWIFIASVVILIVAIGLIVFTELKHRNNKKAY